MIQKNAAYDAALQVVREAINVLAEWSNQELRNSSVSGDVDAVVGEAKNILCWDNNYQIKPLRSLFDSVKLSRGQDKSFYWFPHQISDEYPCIPYPQETKPVEENFEKLKTDVGSVIGSLTEEDWGNLSLLSLILEKYGSFISFGDEDVALVDIARSTSAVAAALINSSDSGLENKNLSLIAGGISGIQDFIYTISSDGALKSLRARSFYLELVTEGVVQQILDDLELPRNSVIYAGGSNLYILASGDVERIQNILNQIRQVFNKWLRISYEGKLFLSLDYIVLPTEAIKNKVFGEDEKSFADYWTDVTKQLAKQKARKFENDINKFLQSSRSYEPCKVCHRDDLPSLKPLIASEINSSSACWVCRTIFDLGDNLFKVKAVLRSKRATVKGHINRMWIPNYYFYFFSSTEAAIDKANNNEVVLTINNWNLSHYQYKYTSPLFLGNYGQRSQEKEEWQKEAGFIRANEMAQAAKGIARVGYLRMDVDKLGMIFAQGLGKKKTLARVAGLSRQMSYFFKVYLNSLAKDRSNNVPSNIKQLEPEDKRLNLLFIYAGGDDLFVSGAWNEVVEFAFDVYQCFRAFTGNNSDITLSGGISIADSKFPLYQAAKQSGSAEDAAKDNDRDSLGLFGKALKWSEWLGQENVNVADLEIFDRETKDYLGQGINLKLFGVFPLVEKLEAQKIELNYARRFVRNLLDTAQVQEQMIKDIEEKQKQPEYDNYIQDIRYYLHLPKIAYSLARLPPEIKSKPDFEPIRQSLMNQYNAPYFRVIATWLELLNRKKNNEHNTTTTE